MSEAHLAPVVRAGLMGGTVVGTRKVVAVMKVIVAVIWGIVTTITGIVNDKWDFVNGIWVLVTFMGTWGQIYYYCI